MVVSQSANGERPRYLNIIHDAAQSQGTDPEQRKFLKVDLESGVIKLVKNPNSASSIEKVYSFVGEALQVSDVNQPEAQQLYQDLRALKETHQVKKSRGLTKTLAKFLKKLVRRVRDVASFLTDSDLGRFMAEKLEKASPAIKTKTAVIPEDLKKKIFTPDIDLEAPEVELMLKAEEGNYLVAATPIPNFFEIRWHSRGTIHAFPVQLKNEKSLKQTILDFKEKNEIPLNHLQTKLPSRLQEFYLVRTAFQTATSTEMKEKTREFQRLPRKFINKKVPGEQVKASFIFMRAKDELVLFRQVKKAEGGLLGKGGFKEAYRTEDVTGSREHLVNSKFRKKRKTSISLALKPLEAFQDAKHLLVGHVLTYVSPRTGETKTRILTPFMDGDMSLSGKEDKVEQLLVLKGLPEKTRLAAMLQMAKGVKEMHDKGWVHHDLKPENVLFRYDPDKGTIEAKVTDFDLADQATKHVRQKGTPGYMAPEVYRESNDRPTGKEANRKTDIFSLGVTFKEVWGHPPIDQETWRTHCQSPQLSQENMVAAGFTNSGKNASDSLDKLVWDMCNPQAPERRPDIDTVITRLEALIKTYPK